jgi:Zn-dependent protease with chaperone function
VPEIFVLPSEDSINALTSGLESDDASIILTMGAIKYLDEGELTALLARCFNELATDRSRHLTYLAAWLRGFSILSSISFALPRKWPRPLLLVLKGLLAILGLFGHSLARLTRSAFSRKGAQLADQGAGLYAPAPTDTSPSLATVLKKVGGLELAQGQSILSPSVLGPSVLGQSILGLPDFAHLWFADVPTLWDVPPLAKYCPTFLRYRPTLQERLATIDPEGDGLFWDFTKNPVNYLDVQKPTPEVALPHTAKIRSVMIPNP